MTDIIAVLDNEVLEPIARFSADGTDDVALALLTGSLVTGRYDRADPNVNVYFFAQPGRARRLRLAAGAFFADIERRLAERRVGFRIDCHPYSVTPSPSLRDRLGTITLTTKVFESERIAERYYLPPTIGYAWYTYHRVLHGDPTLIAPLAQRAAEPAEWLASMHEALSRYRGVVDHLPLFASGAYLAEESVFYAREALRDIVAVATPFDALDRADHFALLSEKREHEMLVSLGWSAEAAVSERVRAWHSALKNGKRATREEGEEAWALANETLDLVWNRYRTRASATLGSSMPWLLRVNAFV